MTRTRAALIGVIATLLAVIGLTITVQGATATGDPKPQICHPVNGKGETGNGWNLISPNKASSHIDEATGAGKHTSHDGRTDVYAVNGACPGGAEPTPYPYEVTVCWSMDNPDLTNANSYEWPQTKASCDFPEPNCEQGYKFQVDKYWIRDKADEDYLAGMNTMTGPESDARLDPHDWYAVLVPKIFRPGCGTPVSETPTPTDDPTPTDEPTPTETPSTTPEPPTPTITTPEPPTPTITTPVIPPVITEPPLPPAPPTEPAKPGKPHVGKPNPPAAYMACVEGTWVTVQDGKVTSRSGTCNPGTPPVPIGDVREEGF